MINEIGWMETDEMANDLAIWLDSDEYSQHQLSRNHLFVPSYLLPIPILTLTPNPTPIPSLTQNQNRNPITAQPTAKHLKRSKKPVNSRMGMERGNGMGGGMMLMGMLLGRWREGRMVWEMGMGLRMGMEMGRERGKEG